MVFDSFTTKLIDERLRQLSSSDSAKASRYQDMLQSLIDSGLQRAELIEEVALQLYVIKLQPRRSTQH